MFTIYNKWKTLNCILLIYIYKKTNIRFPKKLLKKIKFEIK